MENTDIVMRALGHIEGRLDEIRNLSLRVASLEQWQAWLKGAWAVLAAALAYLVTGAPYGN